VLLTQDTSLAGPASAPRRADDPFGSGTPHEVQDRQHDQDDHDDADDPNSSDSSKHHSSFDPLISRPASVLAGRLLGSDTRCSSSTIPSHRSGPTTLRTGPVAGREETRDPVGIILVELGI
jgi:hypothetical protein